MQFSIDPDRLPSGVRIIGDGFVGGKAVGLIFAASAVEFDHAKLADDQELIAFPESVIVATGHFERFMRDNGLENAVQDKCDKKITKLEMAQRFMRATFPPELVSDLRGMLEHERRPLAVRSSSFLEDNLKHSFAGVYQSYFIPNNGSDPARLQQLETAVRLVYLSTFGDNAREYRLKHGIKWQEEKMGVLIQNLIGCENRDHLFYPLMAGVGFSKNFYPWSPEINIDSGVVRVVMGLGTKAVGRNYARVFSPVVPRLRPEGGSVEDVLRYSQREIDALDMVTGGLASPGLDDVKMGNDRIQLVTSELREGNYLMDAPGRIDRDTRLVLTFEPVLRRGREFPFVEILKDLLQNLPDLMEVPVDMEFAVNISDECKFYILQVRPLGGRAEHRVVSIPRSVGARNIILSSQNVLGNGMKKGLRHIVYVPINMYRFDRGFAIARQIGELNASFEDDGYILIGPGRWATSHPELGVPVTYADISNAQVIVECSYGNFTPELSYGTHFFGDMVVSNILYIPVFQEKGDFLNVHFLETEGEAKSFEGLRVVDVDEGIDVYVDGRSRHGIIVRRSAPGGKGRRPVKRRNLPARASKGGMPCR
jgi:hypothetical protein